MSSEAKDNLLKALALLRKGPPNAQPAQGRKGQAGSPDVEELFLAELRVRRARLRQWIEMICREAESDSASRSRSRSARTVPHTCRRRRPSGGLRI